MVDVPATHGGQSGKVVLHGRKSSISVLLDSGVSCVLVDYRVCGDGVNGAYKCPAGSKYCPGASSCRLSRYLLEKLVGRLSRCWGSHQTSNNDRSCVNRGPVSFIPCTDRKMTLAPSYIVYVFALAFFSCW
ncbi:unnamed protein product [Laminaria digitata]